jgi:hypothetical protein
MTRACRPGCAEGRQSDGYARAAQLPAIFTAPPAAITPRRPRCGGAYRTARWSDSNPPIPAPLILDHFTTATRRASMPPSAMLSDPLPLARPYAPPAALLRNGAPGRSVVQRPADLLWYQPCGDSGAGAQNAVVDARIASLSLARPEQSRQRDAPPPSPATGCREPRPPRPVEALPCSVGLRAATSREVRQCSDF